MDVCLKTADYMYFRFLAAQKLLWLYRMDRLRVLGDTRLVVGIGCNWCENLFSTRVLHTVSINTRPTLLFYTSRYTHLFGMIHDSQWKRYPHTLHVECKRMGGMLCYSELCYRLTRPAPPNNCLTVLRSATYSRATTKRRRTNCISLKVANYLLRTYSARGSLMIVFLKHSKPMTFL